MITQISRVIFNYINRSTVLPAVITEIYDGNDKSWIVLRNWPVTSVQSVTVNGQTIPASTGYGVAGYTLEPSDDDPPGHMQILRLQNFVFWKGYANITVVYTCGYQIIGEVQAVPVTSYQVTVLAPKGQWASDMGVIRVSTGLAMTPVSGTPAAGQYSVSGGVYTFAAADVGAQVSISYGYIPADLSMAATEWLGERYRTKDRIGQTSKSLGGQETVSYSKDQVPVFVAQGLQNFRRVVPC